MACLLGAATAAAHTLDHPVPSFSEAAPPSPVVNAGGTNARWELLATIPTGNPHTDIDFFTRGGETYMSAGTLANGPNAGGQTIVKLTDRGAVRPEYVTGHPSASCLAATSGATGLQHDVEAAPKGDVIFNVANPYADRRDAQLLLDSTDATGRCHDNGAFGASGAPQGGIEIIDITNPAAPKEIGLTSHVGQAHTVNVDPKRPHIAFDITQDGVTYDEDGKRANETSGNALDGFEVLDLSSCMNFPAGTGLQAKRDRCRPQVYRFRYPDLSWANSHTYRALQSCHEVEIYPDDKLACSSITATVLLDLSAAFDDNGTPTNYLDDKPRGTPLPCTVRDSTSQPGSPLKTGAKVTDCVNGPGPETNDLIVSTWLKRGAPSLQGVRQIGTVHHMGFMPGDNSTIVNAPYDSTKDIVAAHESEYTGSRRFVLTTDERGGGVVPVGASCSPGVDNVRGNGGIHAFPTSRFKTSGAGSPEVEQSAHARDSKGNYAIHRAPTRTGPQGSVCTSHVFQQIPGQNRIFMGWYSQGTQVVDFTEHANGRFDFKEAGWFTPANADTWTSAIFKAEENADGTFTYWGATGDGILSGTGRNAIDVYKVTLPPAQTYGAGPQFPRARPTGACARITAFDAVNARPRGSGLRLSYSRRGRGRVTLELFRESSGRRILRPRRVRRYRLRRSRRSVLVSGRGLRSGYYVARFRARAANGRIDTRRVVLRRSRGRFRRRPDFDRRETCALIDYYRIRRALFGGTRRSRMVIGFRVRRDARVAVEVRRRGRLVRRFRARTYRRGRRHLLAFRSRGRPRGDYRVTLKATRPGQAETLTLTARRL